MPEDRPKIKLPYPMEYLNNKLIGFTLDGENLQGRLYAFPDGLMIEREVSGPTPLVRGVQQFWLTQLQANALVRHPNANLDAWMLLP